MAKLDLLVRRNGRTIAVAAVAVALVLGGWAVTRDRAPAIGPCTSADPTVVGLLVAGAYPDAAVGYPAWTVRQGETEVVAAPITSPDGRAFTGTWQVLGSDTGPVILPVGIPTRRAGTWGTAPAGAGTAVSDTSSIATAARACVPVTEPVTSFPPQVTVAHGIDADGNPFVPPAD
jgi:hypothetical protein